MEIKNLTKQEFRQKVADYGEDKSDLKLLGDKPVIVDFYAPWCRHCKALDPILEEVAEECKEKVDVYRVDIEKEEELAKDFSIRTIPTLLLVPKNGKAQRAKGEMSKAALKELISKTFCCCNDA